MSGFSARVLGRTGLRVSPLGIGGGIRSRDLLYAFDRGINYFFYSSDLHHHFYRSSARAIRQLCGSGSRVREQVVLATVSYVNDPEKLFAVLWDQFAELGVDYVDVFYSWAKQKKIARLQTPPTQKARGRTAKTIEFDPEITNRGALELEKRTDSNRPTGSGGGKNRGDRRDTNRTYTGNARHAARGNTPRVDVSTRKR